jgi:hypothetical protein
MKSQIWCPSNYSDVGIVKVIIKCLSNVGEKRIVHYTYTERNAMTILARMNYATRLLLVTQTSNNHHYLVIE